MAREAASTVATAAVVVCSLHRSHPKVTSCRCPEPRWRGRRGCWAQVDLAHAATAHQAHDGVSSENVADAQRHCGRPIGTRWPPGPADAPVKLPDSLHNNEIHPMPDWGSSGRGVQILSARPVSALSSDGLT